MPINIFKFFCIKLGFSFFTFTLALFTKWKTAFVPPEKLFMIKWTPYWGVPISINIFWIFRFRPSFVKCLNLSSCQFKFLCFIWAFNLLWKLFEMFFSSIFLKYSLDLIIFKYILLLFILFKCELSLWGHCYWMNINSTLFCLLCKNILIKQILVNLWSIRLKSICIHWFISESL